MSAPVEVWEPVHCAPARYEVSSLGRVRSLDRIYDKVSRNGKIFKFRQVGKMLKPWRDAKGYGVIYICNEQSRRAVNVHRLVALAFLKPIFGKLEVNHKDGNKKNNTIENLEWCTRLENVKHARDTGLVAACRQIVAVPKRGGQAIIFTSTNEAARHLGDIQKAGNIRSVLVGYIPSAYGFKWKYA